MRMMGIRVKDGFALSFQLSLKYFWSRDKHILCISIASHDAGFKPILNFLNYRDRIGKEKEGQERHFCIDACIRVLGDNRSKGDFSVFTVEDFSSSAGTEFSSVEGFENDLTM